MIFRFADLKETDLQRAAKMEWKDFEDAVQCVTAERVGADFIVTRKVKDFIASKKVPAFTPDELLSRYFS